MDQSYPCEIFHLGPFKVHILCLKYFKHRSSHQNLVQGITHLAQVGFSQNLGLALPFADDMALKCFKMYIIKLMWIVVVWWASHGWWHSKAPNWRTWKTWLSMCAWMCSCRKTNALHLTKWIALYSMKSRLTTCHPICFGGIDYTLQADHVWIIWQASPSTSIY